MPTVLFGDEIRTKQVITNILTNTVKYTEKGSKLNVDSVYGEDSTFSFEIEQKVINREPIGDFVEDYRRSLSHHQEYHELFTAPDARIKEMWHLPDWLNKVDGLNLNDGINHCGGVEPYLDALTVFRFCRHRSLL